MYGVIRRYEGVDDARMEEILDLARSELVPKLAEAPGFEAYYLLRAGRGTIASFGVFDDEAGAEKSNEIARKFIREAGMSEAMPNEPQVTAGEITAQKVLQTATA
jgi:hypothetical protein